MSSKALLKISLVLTLIGSAGTAFGAATITTATAVGSSSFSPSANVTVKAASSVSQYSAYAGHLSGNRVYWGNNVEPKLYFDEKVPGAVISNSPAAADTVPSSFTSL